MSSLSRHKPIPYEDAYVDVPSVVEYTRPNGVPNGYYYRDPDQMYFRSHGDDSSTEENQQTGNISLIMGNF